MWSTLCIISIMAASAQCWGVRSINPVTAATPAPAVAASAYQPPLNFSAGGVDQQVLQDVFGSPNLVPPGAVDESGQDQSTENFRPSFITYDEFDWKLTKRVASVSDQNLLLSPLGLKLALAILTEAASGVTRGELEFVLGFDSNSSHVQAKFANILDSLHTKSSQYILDLGSRIYVGGGAEPRQKFASIAEQHYRTEIRRGDFTHPAAAALDINSWISNITHGRIPDLVTEGDLKDAVMLVLNTLYFKGTWRRQFSPNETRLDNFFTSPTMVSLTPFMFMEDEFFYAESIKMEAKILRLPYLGNKFAMYLIVPNSISGLPRILQELTGHQLRQEMLYMAPRNVRVILPRFQFEFASQLDSALKDLGVRRAFSDSASFPGIARGEKLTVTPRISNVMQKSGIELNELGSVVYTATKVTLVNRFGPDDESTVEVNANKPFLFFIEDETTRQLLFTGRISNPAAATGIFH